MIWYQTPLSTSMVMFLALFATVVAQTLIVLQAGELLRNKQALGFVRLLYSSLAVISAILALEAFTAIVSIEGGIYLSIPTWSRYLSILPLLFFINLIKSPVELPEQLRPPAASFFIPLLRLPPADWLPMPWPVACAVLAAAWFMLDAAWMLWSIWTYSRREITCGVLTHIMHNMDHGICIADQRGRILEVNPAFHRLRENLGLSQAEDISRFDISLKARADAGRLKVSDLENGKAIRSEDGVFFLQSNSFTEDGKTYTQVALSDISKTARTASELERENEELARENDRLRAAIDEIEMEEAMSERERLCQAAHDIWSQRLAVAGWSIDILLAGQNHPIDSNTLGEITEALKGPATTETYPLSRDLTRVLLSLTAMYKRLGVEIRASGQADFSGHQQKALCAVLREAAANAVRHAHARLIAVELYEDADVVGVAVRNCCADGDADFKEGRGLHDIRMRVNAAGGTVQCGKGDSFELKVIFPKGEKLLGEV